MQAFKHAVRAPRAPAKSTRDTVVAHVAQRSSTRRVILGTGLLTSGLLAKIAKAEEQRVGEVFHSEEEWRKLLTPAQYRILREAGTELPTTSPLYKEKRKGTYVCAGCSSPLFSSEAKYESGTGWPSFFEPIDGAVEEEPDYSIVFLPRTEVHCKRCKGHLGHVFDDGPPPTGLRYCMNGAAMLFEPAKQGAASKAA